MHAHELYVGYTASRFCAFSQQAEGIFRINPENSKEEHVRDQLNKGNVPTNIDVHCLAGLIKVKSMDATMLFTSCLHVQLAIVS
jgi:hypothetical protein